MSALAQLLRAAALLAVLGAAACQSTDDPTADSIFAGQDIFGDRNPRLPQKGLRAEGYATPATSRSGRGPLSQNFGPDGGLSRMASVTEQEPGQYALNFENADIKDVVRAVLTDALGINYTITGDLAGPVTISSSQPVNRQGLLNSLESALASFGYALVKDGAGYRVAPSGSGVGAIDRDGQVSAGAGVSVVQLRFVSAATMMELLSGFVVENEGLRVDKAGNSIVVRGSGPQRAEAVKAIEAFDADFMQDQSVSIFRLTQARPEAVVPELERIFNTSGDSSLIQFRAVGRLRGIMAISKNGALLRRAETWVRRLDQDSPDAGDNVVVYKAKYRKAAELAKVISGLFGSGAEAAATPQAPAAQQPLDGEEPLDGGQDGASGDANGGEATNVRVASAFDAQAASDVNSAGIGLGTGPNVIDLTQGGASSGPPLRISADPSNNSVVIYGDADRAAEVIATLRRLDATPVQVAINVVIAEVQLTNELKYGVQYYVKNHHGSISLTDVASNVLKRQLPGLNVVFGSDSDPDVIVSALDVIGNVEVLSSPSLVVLENQTASLQVGDEVPITTRQSQSTESGLAPIINQVEFKNTGIILNVTPRISQDDTVTMDIAQEISNVSNGANTLTPTISKRRVESQISVSNNQTVVLAGLISANRDNTKDGVPGINRVPILGALIGNTRKAKDRTELIVLIRPMVIRDDQDAGNVAADIRSRMLTMGTRSSRPLK